MVDEVVKQESQALPETKPLPFSLTTSRQFTGWLAETGTSLAATTYQSGKVILIGSNAEKGRLSVFERTLERPMGLAYEEGRLAIASLVEVTVFVNAVSNSRTAEGYDAVFVPQSASYTADLDVHDLSFYRQGEIVFANTLFSCVATTSSTHSFKPLWRPSFISRLAAEDRCHLNGLAMREGFPAYVTCVAVSDIADGWRDHRVDGGVIIDIVANEIVCRGLSMPHSPRVHDNRLWVLNSGTGEVGTVDLRKSRFEPMAFCPGYLRGLTFIGPYAVVGLSEPRGNRTFEGLPLQERMVSENIEPRCGLYVIDTRSGDIVHWLRFEGIVNELYDVIALPKVGRPSIIGFRSQEIRRIVSIEE